LNKIKPSIREPIFVYGVALVITFLSIIYFSIQGYPHVNIASGILNITTPPIYMIAIFFPYGILLGEIIWIWNEKKGYKMLILDFIVAIIIGILSFIQYIFAISFSGHTVIIFYYLTYQIFRKEYRYKFRIRIGIIVLIITIICKLIIWNDPITFILGGIVGLIIWFIAFVIDKIKFGKVV
jgi:hypothetical protein